MTTPNIPPGIINYLNQIKPSQLNGCAEDTETLRTELATLRAKVERYEAALREIAGYRGENRILEDIAKEALEP